MRKLTLNSLTLKILDQADELTAVVGGQRPVVNPNARPSKGGVVRCLPSLGCGGKSPE